MKDSGLPRTSSTLSRAWDGKRAWFCTDKGLAYYDGVNWAVYTPSLKDGKPEMTVRDAQGKVTRLPSAARRPTYYILASTFKANDIWVATAKGLSSRNSTTAVRT